MGAMLAVCRPGLPARDPRGDRQGAVERASAGVALLEDGARQASASEFLSYVEIFGDQAEEDD
eukprot:4653965-Prorocentrum_lima.AAC.1